MKMNNKYKETRMYHGTICLFNNFELPRVEDGIYFSSEPEYAARYADVRAELSETQALLYVVKLKLRNPLFLDGDDTAVWEKYTQRGFNAQDLRRDGYDSCVLNYSDGESEVMCLNPNQIKILEVRRLKNYALRKG